MSATIAKALHQVMSTVGYVQKSGKNSFHGYKYAGEADLLEKLRPAMLEAGLILIPSVTSVTPIDEHGITTVQIAYTLVHKDGDIWPDKIIAAGMGGDKNKNGVGDKGLYKAITGANKYLLFKLFQIETGDDPEKEAFIPHDVEDESKARFKAETLATINVYSDAAKLGEWWNSEAQKSARRLIGLDQSEANALKDAVLARLEALKGKVAA